MNFTIRTESYEGPLDVLLDLIEKRKLFINDISLAAVADDFIEYVRSHSEFPLSQTAHFVLVASTLLLIKSKSLLPTLSFTEEEEADVEDLKRRLELHALFKSEAEEVRKQFGKAPLLFPAQDRPQETVFSPDASMSVASLTEAIATVMANLPKGGDKLVKATIKKVVSLEEMIDRLGDRIQKAVSMRFREFSGHGKAEKVEVIVGFLAMLELVKQGIIRVTQDSNFDDILMEHDQIGTPRYG